MKLAIEPRLLIVLLLLLDFFLIGLAAVLFSLTLIMRKISWSAFEHLSFIK